jgi:hypothetical protein
MTTFNLNCFLTANGNVAQSGGTWTYGTLSSGLPSGWTNGGSIASPTALDITTYPDGASFPFVYTIGSPPCQMSTTYTLTTAVKLTVAVPTTVNTCVVNGAMNGGSNLITVNVTAPSTYTWTASSSNNLITLQDTMGGGTGNGFFTLTVLTPLNGTALTTGTITVTVTPVVSMATADPACITYSPFKPNPCGDTKTFTINVAPNISAGSTKTSTICSTSLTYNSFDTLFSGTKIVPSGYTETFKVDGTTVTLPYTFATTPSPQILRRTISNSICTTYIDSTVNISTGSSSGITDSLTICNI